LRTPDLLKEVEMIGLVLVTHGRLADELINALEHVVGSQVNVASVCIGPDDDMEKRRNDILNSVDKVNNGAGVVVLTDMFGGSPSNLAIAIMVKVIAGVNLPMLVKIASIRKMLNFRTTNQNLLMSLSLRTNTTSQVNNTSMLQKSNSILFSELIKNRLCQ